MKLSLVLVGLQASLISSSAAPSTTTNELEGRSLFDPIDDVLDLLGLNRQTTTKTTSTARTTSSSIKSSTTRTSSTTKTSSTVKSSSTAKTSSTSTAKTSSTSTVKTSSTSTIKTSSTSTAIILSSSAQSSSSSSALVSLTSSPAASTSSVTSTALATSDSSSASSSVSSSAPAAQSITATIDGSYTVKSTILVLARDSSSASQATSGLNAYGIPFQTIIVPSGGIDLPTLNSSNVGNFGGFMILSGLSYEYSSGWASALTNDQYLQLYAYQKAFRVRMVQYDVYPQAAFGTTPTGTCCDSGVEQLVSFSNTSAFPQAGLKVGAGMSTQGLYHYTTTITDPSTTWEVAQFAANSVNSDPSTAGVINNFNGREQMVFFTTWATDWSPTSNYLQHGAITWMTRGLYAGYRRVNINAQIDDMILSTPVYNGDGSSYRVTPDDMSVIRDWVPTINAKMNPGSFFKPEVGYNGDGTFITVDPASTKEECQPHPIYTGFDETDAEFRKPLGTGVDLWPANAASNYSYSVDCINEDPLTSWFMTPSNRDQLMHISHTFTHEHLNNATYNDVYREISFNQAWLAQTGIAEGTFSSQGLIPPAITGLHNGDALRAMWQLGLRHLVGDNARPALRNTQNTMWPYITNTDTDGFDGMTIVPRWPLRIYWDCDTPACTLQEWTVTGGGSGDFNNLMLQEKNDHMRYYFGGYRDGVMFHQINLRNQGTDDITTPDGTVVRSLYQAWVETMVQEFSRLADWPMISLKQDDLADAFNDRITRDACGYGITWNVEGGEVTGVTVTSTGNTCSTEIPVTVPGSVADTQGFRTEQVGNDPLTVWVKLSGSPVTLKLSSALAL